MKSKPKENYLVVEGYLIPLERDKSGGILQLCIETFDFEKYILDNSDSIKSLFPHVFKKVKVNGKIIDSHLGNSIICVETYSLI